MLDLYRHARPDERFHLQSTEPWCEAWGVDWLYRSVKWRGMILENGELGWFNSYVLLWVFRWYIGNVKCDGGRTYDLWGGRLGTPIPSGQYVMTSTPKEKFSVRIRWRKPDRERWDNQGGIILAAICLSYLL